MKFIVGKIKTREIVALESEMSVKNIVTLMSRFMVDDNNNSIPQDVAYEQLLDLDLQDQIKAQEAFMQAILPNLKRGTA